MGRELKMDAKWGETKRSRPTHPRHPRSLNGRSGRCCDLLGHLLNCPDALHLLVAQDDLPDGIGHGPQVVAGAEAQAVVHLAHQFQALVSGGGAWLHPLVCLRSGISSSSLGFAAQGLWPFCSALIAGR